MKNEKRQDLTIVLESLLKENNRLKTGIKIVKALKETLAKFGYRKDPIENFENDLRNRLVMSNSLVKKINNEIKEFENE